MQARDATFRDVPRRFCRSRQDGSALVVTALVLFLLAAIATASILLFLRHSLNSPLAPDANLYTVERGQSLKGVARTLKQRGLIDEIYSLQVYARFKGVAGDIKAGQYRFEDGINLIGVLEKMVAGDVVRYQVQFIEGWTFSQMREALYAHPELEHRTLSLSDDQIMESLGLGGEHPEGRFFPDTYIFFAGDTDLEILERAHGAMIRTLEEAWEMRVDDLPITTPYEALILASIIEKETGLGSERGTISGVFVNRLRKRMRLQTDPTVIYGMGERFDGNIRRRDLVEDTPYNTYTRGGLPPTPIAMPGRDSLFAAVKPEETDYIYFVSRGDGSHKFSVTLDEHNAAVNKYQRRRRSGG